LIKLQGIKDSGQDSLNCERNNMGAGQWYFNGKIIGKCAIGMQVSGLLKVYP